MDSTLLLVVGIAGAVTLPIAVVFGIPALALAFLARLSDADSAA